MKHRNSRKNENGFSFLSLLISLAIVGILSTVSIVYYNSTRVNTLQVLDTESVGGRLNKTLAMSSLENLHKLQLNYFAQNDHYATFEDLLEDGSIPSGYTAKLEETGVPYLDYWDIVIRVDNDDKYLLLAIPNSKASEFDNVPILGMNETGRIWEEEGLDDYEDDWLESIIDEEDEEIPFFLPGSTE